MKKVAATKGHIVSLADFLLKAEVETAEEVFSGEKAGMLATANFDGCLL